MKNGVYTPFFFTQKIVHNQYYLNFVNKL